MPLVALRSGCPGSRKCPWICQCSVVTRRPKQLVELGFVEGFKIPKTANGGGAAHGTEASMSLVSGHSEEQSSSRTHSQGGILETSQDDKGIQPEKLAKFMERVKSLCGLKDMRELNTFLNKF